jgi:hypothetical protein
VNSDEINTCHSPPKTMEPCLVEVPHEANEASSVKVVKIFLETGYIGFAEKVDSYSHSVDNQGYKLIKIS